MALFRFVLLSKEIQFLFKGFPFLAMSKSSHVIFPFFVTLNIHIVIFLPIFVCTLRVFHTRLNWYALTGVWVTSKSSLVSKTLPSILADFSNAVVCMTLFLFQISNSNSHLSNFLWITFLTQFYLVLYSFCASLLYLLIMWLTVASQSPYYLHLLFYCVLSSFALI